MAVTLGTQNLPGVLGREITTEMAVNLFGIGAGIFGGVAGLVAGQRLGALSVEKIPVGLLTIPLLVAGVSTVVGAFLLPTEL